MALDYRVVRTSSPSNGHLREAPLPPRRAGSGLCVCRIRRDGAGRRRPRRLPLLREARSGEVWITQPTLSGAQPISARGPRHALVADTTPPGAPGKPVAETSGLFLIEASWTDAADPESGIQDYVFAVGTGTTPETQANVRCWQSNGRGKKAKVNLALTQGKSYIFSVRAMNGAGLYGLVARSAPMTATPRVYGDAANQISCTIAPTGIAADGEPTASWPPEKAAALSGFLDQMLPVLRDLYGPPSTDYTVSLVRDLKYMASAVFFPSADEIHAGDNVTYQLLTHELVHAFRRNQMLSSGPQWQFDPTLSGFEEGFAQAACYEAMTEFARRYPSFGLTQSLYQSSNEWDYDFQNVPELRTRDFWSDSGGMSLYWTRYEMAAAAIAKIEREHPGFYRAFNAEYFHRLNVDPHLIASRDLVKDIVQTVAPTIEGRPAAQWIDQQNIFDCADHPGKKVWLSTLHYPAPADYFIFNRVFFYETFSNGSDWSAPNATGGSDYYRLNGSPGAAVLRTSGGSVVWQTVLRITPTENPPVFNGFGNENVSLTTQPTNLPWPGGDSSRYATNLLPFDLYRLSIQLTSGTTVANDSYRVIGAPIRSATGIFGGIVGAKGGTISLNHRSHPAEAPVSVANGVFWATPSWASVSHPETASVDTEPGIVDVAYVDADGNRYTDVRVIGYGSERGNQTFLFDVSRMNAASTNGPPTGLPPTGGTPGPAASSFRTLAPCRAFDSRSASGPAAAAPALDAGASRVFSIAGRCGIPATATALSVNVTVAEPTAAGFLVLYPGDEPVPVASTVAFRPGQTRANNAIIKIAGDGGGTLGISNSAPGPVHFIVDVNGYFE